jgi:flagellar biosynthesis protein FlhG
VSLSPLDIATAVVRRGGGSAPALRIAITSGKGGVGKTSLTINVGVALARLGHRVGLLDADFALGNLDVLLGLTPNVHLGSVLSGDRAIEEIVLEGPAGVRVIPAGSGVRPLASLGTRQWTRLADAMATISRSLDFLLVDTASGISDNVIDVIGLTDYALVVTSYEPAAVVDAYAVVKLLTAVDRLREIGIVVNTARDAAEADRVFKQLSLAADRFLGRGLRYDGFVEVDPQVREAVVNQSPVVGRDGQGPADRCFRRLAQRFARLRGAENTPWPAERLPLAMPVAPGVADPEGPRCAS